MVPRRDGYGGRGFANCLGSVGFGFWLRKKRCGKEGRRERRESEGATRLGKTTKNGEGAPRPTFIQRVKARSAGSWLCPSVPRRITLATSGRNCSS